MADVQEEFKQLLKRKGLKVTIQRIAILEVLKSRPGKHLTAEEIYDYVRRRYSDIGLATVYRTIQLLSDLQLIDRLNLDDGYVRYEIGKNDDAIGEHHHHHLICTECGQIFAFQDDLLEELEKRISDTMGFTVYDHEVKLFGKCRKCQNEQPPCK